MASLVTTTVNGNLNFETAGQYLTFYGGGETEHSISSRNSSGNAADDLRINTFGAIFINLDSNNNNTSGADFSIGRHGQTGAITDWLLDLSGETGKLTLSKYGSGTHTGTLAKSLGVDSSGNVIEFTSLANPSSADISISKSVPKFSLVNTASSSKTWDILGNGTSFYITEAGVADRVTIQAGGNTTLNGNFIIPENKYIYLEGDADDQFNCIGRNSSENAVILTSRYKVAIIIDSNNDDTDSTFSVRQNGTTIGGSTSLLTVQSDGLKVAANSYILNSDGIKQIRFKSTEVAFNEDGRSDVDVRMEGDTDANLFFLDASTDKIGIGTDAPSCLLQLSTTSVQGNALLSIRRNGDAINFGHSNGAGYGSVIGCSVNNGFPHLGFMCEAGTNNNTFRTRGLKGNVIYTNTSGELKFAQITTATADNQTPTDRLTIDSSGNVTQAGGAYEWYDGSGAKVGEISTIGGNNLTISGTQTNHCGLSFATNAILPATQSATNNNTVDLGANGNAFKDFYIQGTAYVRNSGGNNILWGKGTGWGYSPNSYKAIQIGDASGNFTVSIGYDPAGNTSSAFTGDGTELLFRNDFSFVTPNAANNGWHYCMHFKDGNVGIGTNSPGSLFTISGNSDDGDGACTIAINDEDSTVGSKIPAIQFYGGGTTTGRIRGGDASFSIAVGSSPTTALSINTANGYPSFTYGSQVRLTLGSTGTAETNNANWVRASGANLEFNAASGDFNWEVGGAHKMRLTDTGNLGIGLGAGTDPFGTLHCNDGTIGGQIFLTKTSGGTSSTLGRITFGNTNIDSNLASIGAIQDGATDSAKLEFLTQPTGGATLVRMAIKSDGKVGIGTATPYRNAHIYVAPNSDNFEGALQTGGTSAALGGYFGYNSTSSGRLTISSLNNAGGANAKIYLGFGLDGDGSPAKEVMTLTQEGKVIIGGNAPTKTFEVKYASSSINVTEEGLNGGGAGTGILIFNTQASNNVYANLDFRANNADGRIAYQYKTATNVGDFHFITDNTGSPATKMLIANSGSIGAGTVEPGTQLDVNQTAGDNTYPLKVRGNIDNNGGFTGITFGYEGNTRSYEKARIMVEGTTGNVQPNMHFLLQSQANSTSATKGDSKLTILNGGSVGIGTATPANLLNLYGGTDISPTSGGAGQFGVQGNGYKTFLAMDSQAAYFGHNSSARELVFMTNETARLSITGSGAATFSSTLIASGGFFGNGSGLTSLNGSNISSGTVAAARLGSGSSITTKFLRGDNTWQTVSGGGGSGTVTEVTVGTGLDVSSGTTTPNITLDFNELATAGTVSSTDDFVVVDGTDTRKEQMSSIHLNGFNGYYGLLNRIYKNNGAQDSVTPDSSGNIYFYEGTGTQLSFSGNTITFSTTSSDYRLKKNISTFNSEAWTKVKSVNLRKFDFDEDAYKTAIASPDREITVDPKHYVDNLGFIAHELAEAEIKEAVVGDKDGVDEDGNFIYQKVNYLALVPVLWGALNEAISKIETLESKVQALEDK